MTPPYSRLRDIISRANAGDPPSADENRDDYLDDKYVPDSLDGIQPWSTPTRIVEELLEGFDPKSRRNCATVYIDATMEQMKHRRRSMNAIVKRLGGESLSVCAMRLDPYRKGGVSRVSPWKITIVQNVAGNK